MTERQRQNEFLKSLIGFGDTPPCRDLQQRLRKAEHDENSIERKMCGLVLLALLSLSGLGYTRIFVPENFVLTWSLLVKLFSVLALGAGIGLVLFLGCWCWYRAMINGLLEEGRCLVKVFLKVQIQSAASTNISVIAAQPATLVIPEFKPIVVQELQPEQTNCPERIAC